ncbi:MAG TPA: hypothetical protein VFK50_02770 [Sphingomicrobium sp.]|nr:hypothetical protein [Sphingomicrobium sp.]
MMKWILAMALGLGTTPAAAEVVSSGANGFRVRHTVQIVAPTQNAFEAFTQVGGWWDGEHTYSGDAANLSLAVSPGGCFCERIPKTGGGIEHLRVAYVEPGQRLVLTGSLGPLLYEATTGVMDVKVERIAGGSRVVLDYKVAGFADGNAQAMAPLVDSVLGNQMKRFRTYAAKRPRN